MSVREVTMYRVVCDGEDCRASAQDDGEFYSWAEPGQAEDEATERDWAITADGKHYCAEHSTWDDDHDERVPKPGKVVTP